MKALMSIIITIGVFIVAVLFVLAISAPARASGDHCHHDCDDTVTNTTIHKHKDNLGKGIAIGVVATCSLRSVFIRVTESR